MALIDDVKALCDRLVPLGWRDVLKNATHGQLDLQQATSAALLAELSKAIPSIDRTLAGFTDFALDGTRAIEPGAPAKSLLYHALASPAVTAGVTGFATLKEMETVENFVFGVRPPTLAQLRTKAGLAGNARLSIVLFTYEYRPAKDTCTGRQADLVFSRTGVSRVGTRPAGYDARARGFQSELGDDPFAFRVSPARYAAFLAVKVKGAGASIMRKQPGDAVSDFWIPLHKLFAGTECIAGLNLNPTYSCFHYNDKVRRTRAVTLGLANVPTAAPFQLTQGIAELAVDPTLPAGTVVPVVHARLVEPAMLGGALLTYKIPPAQRSFAALEPGATSADNAEVRPAPAYVHARTEVRNETTMIDLNNDPQRPDVNATVSAGNYEALHYNDFTGEGQVDIAVPALAGHAEVDAATVPAYSLIAAPDFFPSAGQRELFESVPQDLWGVRPFPLCDTRLPANLQMPNNRFDPGDKTPTAVVALFGPGPANTNLPVSSTRTAIPVFQTIAPECSRRVGT